jgi:hypothetical protein
MAVPTKADLDKREKKLKEFLKNLDEDGKGREAKIIGVVRSAIRSAWLKSDTKLAYLYMNTIPDMDDSTRTKWLWKCEICGELFQLKDINVDHKWGNHPFTKLEDFPNYFKNILMVGFDDLQILCKDGCHTQKSYAEKNGISFEDAGYMKVIIALEKKKMLKDYIISQGETPKSNAELRREQAFKLMKQEKENVL